MMNLRNPRITIGTMLELERAFGRSMFQEEIKLSSFCDIAMLVYHSCKPTCTIEEFMERVEPEEFDELATAAIEALKDFFTRLNMGAKRRALAAESPHPV